MTYNIPIAFVVSVVLLVSFGATPVSAETGGQVGVCVVGVDSPCNDAEDTPVADQPAGNETPIQFHPDELPYASGLADGDEPADEVETQAPRSRFAQVWAFVVQLF